MSAKRYLALFTLPGIVAVLVWPETAYIFGSADFNDVYNSYLLTYVAKSSWAFNCFDFDQHTAGADDATFIDNT